MMVTISPTPFILAAGVQRQNEQAAYLWSHQRGHGAIFLMVPDTQMTFLQGLALGQWNAFNSLRL